jgi:hypothetical protein
MASFAAKQQRQQPPAHTGTVSPSRPAAPLPPQMGAFSAAASNAGGKPSAGAFTQVVGGAQGSVRPTLGSRDPHTAKLSDYLMQYSQNVTMLHRMVQSLGGIRDCEELRGQYRCQVGVVTDLSKKIDEELGKSAKEVDGGAGVTRQEAARLRAAHAKLSKDYRRVAVIAQNLQEDATQRIADLDRRRREAALEEAAVAARIYGEDGAPVGGIRGAQAQQQALAQEYVGDTAINEAIIQETEAELLNINRSLHQVNEIFKDLATIVAQQQEQVDHIEVSTEAAHQRAQQGLQQVQKAHQYQGGCSIM